MIVACRECGRGVSTEAAVCPHCGVTDPYRGLSRRTGAQVFLESAPPPPPPAARRRPAARAYPHRSGFPMGIAAVAVIAALVVGAGLFLYKAKGGDVGPVPSSGDGAGYPVGEAPKRPAANPVGGPAAGAAGDRVRRLEGQYLTGVGPLVYDRKFERDKPQIEMMLLHEMANCPLLEKAMKYYNPLYITVRNGRFVGDTDGKVYNDHKLCGQCVK